MCLRHLGSCGCGGSCVLRAECLGPRSPAVGGQEDVVSQLARRADSAVPLLPLRALSGWDGAPWPLPQGRPSPPWPLVQMLFASRNAPHGPGSNISPSGHYLGVPWPGQWTREVSFAQRVYGH